MNRRQFMAACLMLIVGACLLDLDRLREWWKSVTGSDLEAFGKVNRSTLTSFSDALKKLYPDEIVRGFRPAIVWMSPHDRAALLRAT